MSLYSDFLEICKAYEFPHSHFYESDLKELLKMFAFLKSEYGKTLQIIDEINIKLDTLDSTITDSITKALEPYTVLINETVDNINKQLANTIESVDNKISVIETKVQNELNVEKIERMKEDADIINLLNSNIETLEKAIAELKAMIIDSGIAVVNPRRSEIDTIQNVVNDLYLAILQSGSYTSTELSVYPTCNDIKVMNLTYDEFTVSNKQIGSILIDNPVTGTKGSLNYALSSLKGYNHPLGLSSDEMAEKKIANDNISNAMISFNDFICRSGVVLDSSDVSLGLWEDGKQLHMSLISIGSAAELETVVELNENIDRIVDIIVLSVNNNGIVEDITANVEIDIDINAITIPISSEKVAYDIKILWT